MLNRTISRRNSFSPDPWTPPDTGARRHSGGLVRGAAKSSKSLSKAGRFLKFAGRLSPWLTAATLLVDLVDWQNANEGWIVPAGWSEWGKCPNQTYTDPCQGQTSSQYQNTTIKNLCDNCTSGQVVQGYPVDAPWSTTAKTVSFGNRYQVPGPTYRMTYKIGYTNPASGSKDAPYWGQLGAAFTRPVPKELGRAITARPEIVPPGFIIGWASPVSWEVAPYWAHPQRQTWNGPTGRAMTRTNMRVNNWSIEASSTPQAMQGPPRVHVNSRVSTNERERKDTMSAGAAQTLRTLGELSEAIDIIESFHRALPEDAQARYRNTDYRATNPRASDMLRALWDNYDQIDIARAYQNLLENALEDQLYGQMGRVGATVSREHGHAYGAGGNSLMRVVRRGAVDAMYNREYDEQANQEDAPPDNTFTPTGVSLLRR